jgi:DNA-binding PadR family transcriptional regulator
MKNISTLEFALMGLLRQKAQSGYDLRKTFTETAMRHYSDSPGSIYPALRRLARRGLIEAEPKDRRGREVFHMTVEGVSIFLEWLGREVTRDAVMLGLKELMLRFAFMDGNVPRSTAIRFLEQFEREFEAYVGELRAKFERDSYMKPAHTGLLAFQSGVEGMEAQLSWARKARGRLMEDLR